MDAYWLIGGEATKKELIAFFCLLKSNFYFISYYINLFDYFILYKYNGTY